MDDVRARDDMYLPAPGHNRLELVDCATHILGLQAFRHHLGPDSYLAHWNMELARHRLIDVIDRVAVVIGANIGHSNIGYL